MGVRDWIRENRRGLERELAGGAVRRYASPILYGLEAAIARSVPRLVEGATLDVGCGRAPYRRLIERHAERYESVDFERLVDDQTYVADIQAMPVVPTGRYNAVLCSEVLEHVPRPRDALSELHRVLRPGGALILTVPYLSRLHDEPHDYYRYTLHGLRHLLTSAGFTDVRIERTGSVFSFLGHQLATVLIGTTWGVPGLRWLVFWLTAALVTLPSRLGDAVLGSDRLPAGYIVLARREDGTR